MVYTLYSIFNFTFDDCIKLIDSHIRTHFLNLRNISKTGEDCKSILSASIEFTIELIYKFSKVIHLNFNLYLELSS